MDGTERGGGTERYIRSNCAFLTRSDYHSAQTGSLRGFFGGDCGRFGSGGGGGGGGC